MEQSIQFAKKYLEDLISFFGLNTDITASTEDDEVIELNIPSSQLNGFLIGQRGETVRAMQFMVSNVLRNNGFEITRVNVDVADYKKIRAEHLADQAREWIETFKTSGTDMALQPMNAADRRVVHKVAAGLGVKTASDGDGQERHVVLIAA